MSHHPFWQLLLLACLVWYSTVTVYIAVRGARDIRQMLARLAAGRLEEAGTVQTDDNRTVE